MCIKCILNSCFSCFFTSIHHAHVLSASLRRPDVSRSFSAPFRVRLRVCMMKFYSFDKPPDTTLFSSYLLTCCVLFCFVACLFPFFFFTSSRFCNLLPKMLPWWMIACVCPVHASHPFVVLPYQPAYVSRFFSALFLRVPHRGCCTGFYLPNCSVACWS